MQLLHASIQLIVHQDIVVGLYAYGFLCRTF